MDNLLLLTDNIVNFELLIMELKKVDINSYIISYKDDIDKKILILQPVIIIFDFSKESENRVDIFKQIKNLTIMNNISVIFLSNSYSDRIYSKLINLGVDDYLSLGSCDKVLSKIKREISVKKRWKNINKYISIVETTNIEIQEKIKTITSKNKILQNEISFLKNNSGFDSLTSLINRKGITLILKHEEARVLRGGDSFSLVIVKLNNIDEIFKKYGENFRDIVINGIAQYLLKNLRKQDSVSRWNFDTFLIFLPQTPIDGGKIKANRLKEGIKKRLFYYNDHVVDVELQFTISELKKDDNLTTILNNLENF